MLPDEHKLLQRRSILDPMKSELAAPSTSATPPDAAESNLAQNDVPIEQLPAPAKVDTEVYRTAKVDTQPQSPGGNSPVSKTLGRYTVLKEIGRGGMGTVYLAEDTILKRNVALKLPQFEPHKQEQMQARFIREAQMAAQLSHVNICQVYDVGMIDGQYVMAMEYIEGKTLAEFTKKASKPITERQAVLFVRKVAQAVELAHQRGLIHRDLKPGNIMLPKPDPVRKVIEPKVMDFGLAKSLEARTTELTKTGMIVGTPCYMSKEQWSGKETKLGPQCDVYSLGIILYELLTGNLPYDVEDDEPATAWFVQLVTKPQIKPSERKPGFDPALESIVLKAIAKELEDRYLSMAAFAMDLEAWLKGKPVQGMTQLGMQLSNLPDLSIFPPESNRIGRSRPTKKSWNLWSWCGAVATVLLGSTCLYVINSDSDNVNSKGAVAAIQSEKTPSQKLQHSPPTFGIESAVEQRSATPHELTNESSQKSAQPPPTANLEVADEKPPAPNNKRKLGIRNGDFAEGLEGWETDGGASGFRVYTMLSGVQALTTSSVTVDFPVTGRLFQRFYVPDDARELEFFACGGASPNLYIALKMDEKVRFKTGAYNDNTYFRVNWDVSSMRGKLVTLEIVDMQTGRWQHIGAHSFRFLKEGEE